MLDPDFLLMCRPRAEPPSTPTLRPHTTALSTAHNSNSAVKSILPPPQHAHTLHGILTQCPGTWGGAASSEVSLGHSQKVAAQGTARRHSPRKPCSGSQPIVLSDQPTLPPFSLPSALPPGPHFPFPECPTCKNLEQGKPGTTASSQQLP